MFFKNLIKTNKCLYITYHQRRKIMIEAKIHELGLTLPAAATPRGNYITFMRTGNIVFIAGHIPLAEDGKLITGRVGENITVEEAYDAAKCVGLHICSTLKYNLGDLDKVKRILKLTGFVNCVDNFTQQPSVINGCSDLMVQIFGEKGRHTRSAVGTNILPLNVCVEIEAIVEVEE